ncbi:MAG: hypothetical protein AAGJ95_09535 [Cyanobacteria bacterium J06554_11]
MNTATKYAGAGWLQNTISKQLPPLGIRVANVLGQVFQGIYHIDRYVLHDHIRWDSQLIVSVTVKSEFATFDASYLTMLVFACQHAGLEVSIYGSFKGFTKLMFKRQTGAFIDWAVDEDKQPWDGKPKSFLYRFAAIKREIWRYNSKRFNAAFSTEPLNWINLSAMVGEAHRQRVRVGVVGNSPRSLRIQVSQRLAEGSMFERHPSLEEHREMLKPFVDVDYDSLD